MNEMLEITVHKQLLPDIAVDPKWCSHICQLNSDIPNTSKTTKKKSHSRNLRDIKYELQVIIGISYIEKGVGKEQKRNYISINMDNIN